MNMKGRILAIADELEADGVRPTMTAVRAKLGGGSFSTISPILKERRERLANNAPAPLEEAPPEVAELAKKLAAELWHFAGTRANGRLEEERKALENARIELQVERDDAIAAADEQVGLADALKAEIEKLKNQNAKTEAKLTHSQSELERLRNEMAKEAGILSTLRDTNQALLAAVQQMQAKWLAHNLSILNEDDQSVLETQTPESFCAHPFLDLDPGDSKMTKPTWRASAEFVGKELATLLEVDLETVASDVTLLPGQESVRADGARPRLWVVAGPNGAGKSTLVDKVIAGRLPVVNPDDIAVALPRRPDGTVDELAAGRHALLKRQEMIGHGRSFAVETTLAGANPLRFIREASQRGYQVTLVYIGLDSADLSLQRVRNRVAAGGHDVPVEAIMRRYPDTMAKLATAIDMADTTYVIDNSGTRQRLLMTVEAGRAISLADQLPAWAAQALPPRYLNTLAR